MLRPYVGRRRTGRFGEMDMPWTTLTRVDLRREYSVLLSYLPLRTFSKIPAFFRYTFQIPRQLRNTAGAVGYSMRAKVLSRKFWTLRFGKVNVR